MSHLHLEVTRERLREWGNWYRFLLLQGLGYTGRTLLGQLRQNQGVMIRGTGDLTANNPDAEEVDYWLNQLRKYNPLHAQVVKQHYCTRQTVKERIKKLGISGSYYFYCLKNGEKWLHRQLGYSS